MHGFTAHLQSLREFRRMAISRLASRRISGTLDWHISNQFPVAKFTHSSKPAKLFNHTAKDYIHPKTATYWNKHKTYHFLLWSHFTVLLFLFFLLVVWLFCYFDDSLVNFKVVNCWNKNKTCLDHLSCINFPLSRSWLPFHCGLFRWLAFSLRQSLKSLCGCLPPQPNQ